jgi:translation initiation factor 3 subunit B
MSQADFDYYRSQADYEEVKKYLSSEPVVIDEAALPAFKPDFSSVIVVDNLPIVNRERMPKLLVVLFKLYSQVAAIAESDIFMPFKEAENTSIGCCTVTFPSREFAESAIKLTQGYTLGKNVFKVNRYSDVEVFDKITKDDSPPELKDFHPRPDCRSWLKDEQVRDMFAVRYGRETEVNWYNTTTNEAPTLVYNGSREQSNGKVWCEMQVEWSPQGMYFVTFHGPGVKLWGGADFQPLGKFMHPKVEEISFSPDENYLITYRTTEQHNLDPNEAIIVWDVRTGLKIRSFPLRSNLEAKFFAQGSLQIEDPKTYKKIDKTVRGKIKEFKDNFYYIEEGNTSYPVEPSKILSMQDPNKLKWSSDGKYFARLGPDMISIYNSVDGSLLNSKSFAAPDVLDFAWSPKDNYLAYWSPAMGNHPAVVSIVHITDNARTEIGSRKLVDVTDGKLSWQGEGNYLCVHMTKNQSKKRSFVFLFFRIRAPGIPVEQLELTEQILKVCWEPRGDRIAIAHGEARNPTISFYTMITKTTIPGKGSNSQAQVKYTDQICHLFSKSGSPVTEIQWSPAGTYVTLAQFATECCRFEILDVANNVSSGMRQHDRCTRLSWDPSGRYVATVTVTELRNINSRGHIDDGVNFFHFQGHLVYQLKREKVFAFHWRPRPDLLSPEERKAVAKKLKLYERQFEREDKERRDAVNKELKAARFETAKQFIQWRNRNRQLNAALKSRRVEFRDGYDSDDDRNYDVITVHP